MTARDEAFLARLAESFRVEADEHQRAIAAGLATLGRAAADGERASAVERVLREAHTLKGAARAVGRHDVEALSHAMEGVLAALKRSGAAPPQPALDALLAAADALADGLSSPEGRVTGLKEHLDGLARLDVGGGPGPAPVARTGGTEDPACRGAGASMATTKAQLTGPDPAPRADGPAGQPVTAPADAGASPPVADRSPSAAPPESHTERAPAPAPPLPASTPVRQATHERVSLPEAVRVPTARLESLLRQAEEMRALKLTLAQRAADLHELATLAARPRDAAEARPAEAGPTPRDTPPPQCSRDAGPLKELASRLSELERSAERDHRAAERMVDALLDDAKRLLMLPASSLLEGLPRLVRELARDRGREVELVVEGSEVELDKRVLEGLREPLIHIVRNCIDHGVEPPGERERLGKPRCARISVTLSRPENGRAELAVSDDGAGIDVARVKDSAVRLGILAEGDAASLGEREALGLVFASGVSTSPAVTELSGRGVGLAIVEERVQRLGGSVAVESAAGRGTTLRLAVPVTLARFRGVLVRERGRTFVVPSEHVETAIRVRAEDVRTVEGRDAVALGGRPVALARLGEVLGLAPRGGGEGGGAFPAVVVRAGQRRVAFGVDEVVGEQEVLVKGLGRQLARVPNVSGATVLGSGELAPILDPSDLIRSAAKEGPSRAAAPEASPGRPRAQLPSILVVEDSVTARMLLANILESAGYPVATAVDGADAFARLREGAFGLVVSDVQMPRMDGFELTRSVRADRRLAELPVVLVTALDSPEDRERGIDAGANAYIVKSVFDQSNLLETIQRFL